MKDLELLEISGYIAYDDLKVEEIVIVNEVKFEVVNISYSDYSSGMQAATLQNLETGEYVIAYQGTDPSDFKDIMTDLSLGGPYTSKQLKDAKHYYETMKAQYDVRYVCGNSLGGALANYVAVNYEDVQSVTYNPAILPGIVKCGERNNIRNYLGKHDPLTILELAAGYRERIPGKHIIINNNIPALQFLIANHVGYIEGNEIRLEGRETPIHVNLISGLPFSVFTNDFLSYGYQGNGQKINIDEGALNALCKGIDKIRDNMTYAQSYLDEAKGIVDTEGSQFYSRLEELQSVCGEIFSSLGFNFLSDPYALNNLRETISDLRKNIRIGHVILSSTVLGMVPLVSRVNHCLGEVADLLGNVNLMLDRLEQAYFTIKNNGIPTLFQGVDTIFDDGLPMKLGQHLSIIQSNRDKVMNRLEIYKTQVEKVLSFMQEGDSLNATIENIPINSIPIMDETDLEENQSFENIVSEKNKQFEENFKNFKLSVHKGLDEELSKLYKNALKGYNNIQFIAWDLLQLENFTSWFDIPILKADDQIIKDLNNFCKKLNKIISEFLPALRGIVGILQNAKEKIDEILEAMKPYIKNAIFSNNGYNDVMIYSLSACNIYESASVVFEDIRYQLSENKSQAIDKLSKNAGILKDNLLLIMGQIQKGTIH
ncbi:MAG: DUF2974 domain-containing protein [Erysipelotrichaceae bacterium]|nr:DUF2974 domain-containing protein [Erysipelotrichaceae bacterium]